jgi:hypothetical protein
MSSSLPPVPVNAPRYKLAAYIRSPEISHFLTNYYSHHRFVCQSRFTRVQTSSTTGYNSDSQYPDLNAHLMLPTLQLPADTTEIKGLRIFKLTARCALGASLPFFAGGPAPGVAALCVGAIIATAFTIGYRERLSSLSTDLTNAMAALTPQARTVLSTIVKSFDTEEDDIPAYVQTYADATFYLSNLRKRMYQAIEERESSHQVKLAEIEAAARVAFAV